MFRSEKKFRTTHELEYYFFLSRKARNFFPEINIRLYDKNSESDYFFFLHQNQNIFFSNIGNQNIFLEKNHNPPLQVKWSFPKFFKYMICRFIFSQTSKPRPGVCPAIRKVSKDFCARAFVVSDCKGKDSDCPKGIPLQRAQRVFFYISHYSVTEINPFHDGSVVENTTEQVK